MALSFYSLVSASKGAIEALTLCLPAELAPKVRVNCIAPSLTDTPLAEALLNSEEKKEANAQRHPLKRISNVNDLAEMPDFKPDQILDGFTGQVSHADGDIKIKNQ